MKKSYVRGIVLFLGLLGLDLVTKYFFYDMEIGAQTLLLEPLFNTGISRGVQIPAWIIYLFTLLGLGVFTTMLRKKLLPLRLYVLFVAGTMGNLLDRIMYGGVRDFISVWTFPVFNMADVFLTVGVILFMWLEWRAYRKG